MLVSIRSHLFIGLLAGLVCVSSGPPRAYAADTQTANTTTTTPSRLNILLITADDLNYDTPGFAGGIAGVTPNIDRLASESMRVEHAHVTIAVCMPSRSVLMTGRYPHRNGAKGFNRIHRDVPTLQESLRAAGYLNGIMGKVRHLAPQRKFCWDTVVTWDRLGKGRDPALYYKHAKNFFEKSKQAGKLFFLMANSHDPHRPFAGSEQEKIFLKRWRKQQPDLTITDPSRWYQPDEIKIPGFLPDIPNVRREIAQYYSSVGRCDETVGQILRALKETGFEKNTLVMFLSDNGMAFPFAKTNCYLTSTRTPWLVRWPGKVKPGTADTQHMISGIDYMPTILEAAGLAQIEGMDGHSFLPLLVGESQSERTHVFTVFNTTAARKHYPMRCIQSRKFGYLFNAWSDGETVFKNESQSGLTFKAMQAAAKTDEQIAARVRLFRYRVPQEFYDFEKDPCARKNLIDDPAYQAEIKKLQTEMLNIMTSTDDPLLDQFKKRVLGDQ